MSVHKGVPDAIVYPQTVSHLSKILKLANTHRIPIIPRGAGTSVVGAVIATRGGIILDLSAWNRIRAVQPKDLLVEVECGVVLDELNKVLSEYNLFFPPDPGSSSVCTIGGMICTNASGLHAAKYGTTKDYVLGLEVVLPNGKQIRTGSKALKTSTGFDLTRLFVGSQGTLGVVTAAILRVRPLPRYVCTIMAPFDTLVNAGNAVSEILARGISPAVIEILDRISIQVINKVIKLELPEVDGIILFEVDGMHVDVVNDDTAKIIEICEHHQAKGIKYSMDPKERMSLWRGRKALIPALSRMKDGYRSTAIGEDIGVPISKIPEAIKRIQAISKKHGIIIATFGHVGDGNLHPVMMINVRDKRQWSKYGLVARELIELALEYSGTLTTEHGLGIAKASFAKLELGYGFSLMRSLKRLLDPNNIMNPGVMGFDKITKPLDYFVYTRLLRKKRKLRLTKRIESELLKCIFCGFCRAVCPMFDLNRNEAYNARGRLALAYEYHVGSIPGSQELLDIFYQCTTCKHCYTACPAGADVVNIVEAVRAELVADGFTLPAHQKVVAHLEQVYNPFGEPVEKRLWLNDYIKKVS
jgi:glycolate oxidase